MLGRPNGIHQGFNLQLELLYAAIIIIICIIIYQKTKELYQLSNHQGIKLFRQTFLFFALAFLFRLIPLLFKITDFNHGNVRIGFLVGFYFFGYASSMAILTLARSMTWKKIKKNKILNKPYIYHLIAFLLPGTIFITNSRTQFFLLQAGLIVSVFILIHFHHQKRKKQSSMQLIYSLLLLFWMMNLAIVSIPRFMSTIIYTLYLLSTSIFIIILYKVIGRTRK